MAAFETAAPDLKPLLGERTSRLGLKLEGYPMERYVADLYRELEAKGAFNDACKLFETPAWRERIGPFNRPYRERYRLVPFHRGFVRHMQGWYAQKPPDEDFAETL